MAIPAQIPAMISLHLSPQLPLLTMQTRPVQRNGGLPNGLLRLKVGHGLVVGRLDPAVETGRVDVRERVVGHIRVGGCSLGERVR